MRRRVIQEQTSLDDPVRVAEQHGDWQFLWRPRRREQFQANLPRETVAFELDSTEAGSLVRLKFQMMLVVRLASSEQSEGRNCTSQAHLSETGLSAVRGKPLAVIDSGFNIYGFGKGRGLDSES